jgi:hypothetical protein
VGVIIYGPPAARGAWKQKQHSEESPASHGLMFEAPNMELGRNGSEPMGSSRLYLVQQVRCNCAVGVRVGCTVVKVVKVVQRRAGPRGQCAAAARIDWTTMPHCGAPFPTDEEGTIHREPAAGWTQPPQQRLPTRPQWCRAPSQEARCEASPPFSCSYKSGKYLPSLRCDELWIAEPLDRFTSQLTLGAFPGLGSTFQTLRGLLPASG